MSIHVPRLLLGKKIWKMEPCLTSFLSCFPGLGCEGGNRKLCNEEMRKWTELIPHSVLISRMKKSYLHSVISF